MIKQINLHHTLLLSSFIRPPVYGRDLDVSSDPLNALLWDTIFKPLGGAAP